MNNILLSAIIAFTTWSWVSYITNWQLIAVLASVCTTALYIVLAVKSPTNSTPNTPLVDSLAIHMCTTNSQPLIDSMLQYYLYNTTALPNNYILATKNNITYLVFHHNSLLELDANTACDIVATQQQHSIDKITVIANSISIQAMTILRYNNIIANVINTATLYKHLEKASLLPKLHSIQSKTKGIVASYALCRQRTKHYAISAIFLLLISQISYLPLYTLIWATILLALALYSRFNTRYNTIANAHLQL